MDTRDTTAAGCCRLGKGMHYRSAEWLRLAEAGCWSDCWPEIDRDGLITGRTIGDEPGFLNVGEEAMIAEDEARAGGWTIDEDDCRAEPPAAAAPQVEVVVGHRSGIAGVRWCRPAGWSPRNCVEGADWSDEDGAWLTEDGEAAGLVVFTQGEEGQTVTVGLDDLRVASSGDCRVIGNVVVDFA